jgi:uncharacterized CHY-type Zn-finger protein
VGDFVQNLQVAKSDTQLRGITWLELYILYRCRGYQKPIKDPENMAQARATADKQIRAFKKTVKSTASRTLQDSVDLKMFDPVKPEKDSLKGIGMLGKHAAISCNVYITEAEEKTIAVSIVKLNRTISNQLATNFINGTHSIVPNELNLKGKVGWDSTIPTVTQECSGQQIDPVQQNRYQVIIGNTEFFEFPRCNKVEPSTIDAFKSNDLDTQHKCFHCNKNSAIKSWRCKCGVAWHTCLEHNKLVHEHPQHRSKKAKTSHPVPSQGGNIMRKRKAVGTAESEYDALLARDCQLEERLLNKKRKCPEMCIQLGSQQHTTLKPNLIGPTLAHRFMGGSSGAALGSSSSSSSSSSR